MSLRSFKSAGVLLFLLLATSIALEDQEFEQLHLKKAKRCSISKCKLPNCRCSGLPLPNPEFRGKERQIPQLVTVTFDDAVNTINYEQYQQLFEGLINADGCDARATFYVSHEYTDYSKVNALYSQGHEIALHSVTHGDGTEYWRAADVPLLMSEFGSEIDILEKFAKVQRKDIRGMRLPFLQIAGNNSFVAAQRLGLTYDSSWPTQKYKDPPMWPYTLDYRSVQDCQIGPCPNAAVPGFWINPMVSWTDKQGYSCSMIDGCIYPPEDKVEAIFEWFMENFKRHYESNRAPFGMYLHAAWFARGKHYFEAFRKFLLHINKMPNVYFTTASGVIEYMRNPVLGKPFEKCPKKPETSCIPRSCGRIKESTGDMRYITVCDTCPSAYPWLDNPLGEAKDYVEESYY